MDNVTVSQSSPVLSFAREEWSRLFNISSKSLRKHPNEVWIGTWEELKLLLPQLLEEVGSFEWRDTGYSDEFVIMEINNTLVLSGKSERAALYAVYQYAQEAWGIHAVTPEEAPAVSVSNEKALVEQQSADEPGTVAECIRWYAPRMERRGFVIETLNEPSYLKSMLDWFGHNKINELFLTFMLWDQVGDEIAPEIIKRGIMVTLGGHSMKFFLNKDENIFQNTQVDHPYTAKVQFNFLDSDWQESMQRDIVHYCLSIPNLTRISLWPEDIADRATERFLEYYITFTEQLKVRLLESGLEVEVEHIAYNAGLAWNMLELTNSKSSADVDTLFAFWGRDYRYGYDESPHESDHRAKEALENWTRELGRTDRKLTIFEYYSDHFMLSNLFSFLSQRILKDISYYESCNVLGIVDLVVPYRGPEPYPWKWVHSFNSYVFCKALWSDNLEEIVNDYYTSYPESERAGVKALFEVIEAKLVAITFWNIPLFPARVADAEKAVANKEQKEDILALLLDIKESIQKVMQQYELASDSQPYQYAQHIIRYSDNLYQRWLFKLN